MLSSKGSAMQALRASMLNQSALDNDTYSTSENVHTQFLARRGYERTTPYIVDMENINDTQIRKSERTYVYAGWLLSCNISPFVVFSASASGK
jgi:hypothetical protein